MDAFRESRVFTRTPLVLNPGMTPKELDQHVENLKILQRTDPAAAATLCEAIVREALASGYDRSLPYAHVIHANIIRMQGRLDEAADELETAIGIARNIGERELEGRA